MRWIDDASSAAVNGADHALAVRVRVASPRGLRYCGNYDTRWTYHDVDHADHALARLRARVGLPRTFERLLRLADIQQILDLGNLRPTCRS